MPSAGRALFHLITGLTKEAIGQRAESYLCASSPVLNDGPSRFPAVVQADWKYTPYIVADEKSRLQMLGFG